MNAYIVSAARTAIGNFNGTLKDVHPADIAKSAIEAALERGNLQEKKSDIDEVILGCILQAGHGQGVARQATLKSNIPIEVPATTVNILCGSGLYSVIQGAKNIKAEDGDLYVTGGTENMSQAPYILKKARNGFRLGHGEVNDSMISDALWDAFNDYHMGITAENLAEKYEISREEMDNFALESQKRATDAKLGGKFKDEICDVEIKTRKKTVVFNEDEYIKTDCEIEGLQKLRAAFKKDGKVTAGNASGINDGAAAVVVASESYVKENNLKPMARIVSWGVAGVDPSIMGIGPVAATKKALERANLKVEDIDLIESNEAFAAQSLSVAKELGFDNSKVNVNGGAIALGHPVGASGARILTTLLYEMKKRDSKYGLATLCVGGGMGVSLIVENL